MDGHGLVVLAALLQGGLLTTLLCTVSLYHYVEGTRHLGHLYFRSNLFVLSGHQEGVADLQLDLRHVFRVGVVLSGEVARV